MTSQRTLEGLHVEHEIAMREGKLMIAKHARVRARAIAAARGEVCPTWAQGWDP